MALSKLENSILKSKGVSDDVLAKLADVGIESKSDFTVIGDAETLSQVTGIDVALATEIMTWAVGAQAAPVSDAPRAEPQIIVDSPDIVKCANCQAKQPSDYSSGDLCFSCGQQAEPTSNCHWCNASGPGKFCRSCGTGFVPVAEFNLAQMLKQDGVSKDEITGRLANMSENEKNAMWARLRSSQAK